jgi:predicted  nucleic acid-binding Zn-ribbon protein
VTTRPTSPTETIECPLCAGAGKLKRTKILDRLGVKDFARVAQLSAEEAFRLLQSKHDREHQSAWSRFETELAKRTVAIKEQHKDALRSAQSEKESLSRRVEDCLRELADLRERNQELEGELTKTARIGKREEMSFEDLREGARLMTNGRSA